jgi:hypothetical protein
VKVVQGLHQVLRRAAPAAELCDQDRVDLARLRQRHDLLALGAVVFRTRGCLFEDRDDFVPCALGEGTQIAFLPLAGLVLGADPAVDGDLSQLNPPAICPVGARKYVANRCIK